LAYDNVVHKSLLIIVIHPDKNFGIMVLILKQTKITEGSMETKLVNDWT